MDLHHLQAFVTVAQEGNVTRAAERLFTSQPAVSTQIKALEQEFGVDLFNRTPAGMVLTEAGKRMLGQAKTILEQSTGLTDLARHLRDGTAGTLRVGINNSAKSLRIDELTRRLVEKHPKLMLHFEHGPSGIVLAGVKAFDLDIGFVEGRYEDVNLYLFQLTINDICVVYPKQWENDLREASWQEIQNYPWVFTSPNCSYYRLLEDVSEEHGLKLQNQFSTDQDGTALHFVSNGMAVSVLDRVQAQAAVEEGTIAIWPHFEARLPVSLCVLKRRLEEKPIAAFIEAAKATFDVGSTDTVAPARD